MDVKCDCALSTINQGLVPAATLVGGSRGVVYRGPDGSGQTEFTWQVDTRGGVLHPGDCVKLTARTRDRATDCPIFSGWPGVQETKSSGGGRQRAEEASRSMRVNTQSTPFGSETTNTYLWVSMWEHIVSSPFMS